MFGVMTLILSLTHEKNLGWAGLIRIDGVPYRWLGHFSDAPTLVSVLTEREVTPTSTRFRYTSGPMDVNVTFLSPIEVSRLQILSFRSNSAIIHSLPIGSNSRCHLLISMWKQPLLTGSHMMFKFIRI